MADPEKNKPTLGGMKATVHQRGGKARACRRQCGRW
jgi:hypothetical protein